MEKKDAPLSFKNDPGRVQSPEKGFPGKKLEGVAGTIGPIELGEKSSGTLEKDAREGGSPLRSSFARFGANVLRCGAHFVGPGAKAVFQLARLRLPFLRAR